MRKLLNLLHTVILVVLVCIIYYVNTNVLTNYDFSGENLIITSNVDIDVKTLNDPNIINLKKISSNKDKNSYIYEADLLEPNKLLILDLVDKMKENKFINTSHPNYFLDVVSYGIPNDFYYNNDYEGSQTDRWQWASEKINLYNAWTLVDNANLTKIVKVGVLDDGINLDAIYYNNSDEVVYAYEHEDLVGVVNLDGSKNYSTSTDKFSDLNNHGTAIIGIIGASRNNYVGIAGVSNKVEIYSLKQEGGTALNSDYTISSSVQAFNYATEMGIEIMNCSFGFMVSEIADSDVKLGDYENVNIALDTLKMAINNYPGLVVCAAGNKGVNVENNNLKVYPACFDCENIISVGAMTINNERWINNELGLASNYGIVSVDLFAPGEDILSTFYCKHNHASYYDEVSGTSFAAPYVTGVAALLMSMYTDMSILEVKCSILHNVICDDYFTNLSLYGGYLDAYGSLNNPKYYDCEPYNDEYHFKWCDECGCSEIEPHQWRTVVTRAVPGGYKECKKCYIRKMI